jgi:hypothetical protein
VTANDLADQIGGLVIALIFSLPAVYAISRRCRLYRYGIRTQGRVLRHVDEIIYAVTIISVRGSVVEFTDYRGRHVELRTSREFPINSLVPVVYLKNNPCAAEVHMTRGRNVAIITGLLLICALCLYVSVDIILNFVHV